MAKNTYGIAFEAEQWRELIKILKHYIRLFGNFGLETYTEEAKNLLAKIESDLKAMKAK